MNLDNCMQTLYYRAHIWSSSCSHIPLTFSSGGMWLNSCWNDSSNMEVQIFVLCYAACPSLTHSTHAGLSNYRTGLNKTESCHSHHLKPQELNMNE